MQQRIRSRGFTVVEVATALVIAAILIAIAAPAFGGWLASLRVRTTTDALAAGLRVAHTEALRRNRGMDFVMTNDVAVTTAAASTTARGWQVRTTDSPPNVVEVRAAGESGSDIAITATAGTVRFSGSGRTLPLGTSFAVNVASNVATSRPLRVVVTPGGAIRTCDPSVSATDARGC